MDILTKDELTQLDKLDEYWRIRLASDNRAILEVLVEKGLAEKKLQQRRGFQDMYRLIQQN